METISAKNTVETIRERTRSGGGVDFSSEKETSKNLTDSSGKLGNALTMFAPAIDPECPDRVHISDRREERKQIERELDSLYRKLDGLKAELYYLENVSQADTQELNAQIESIESRIQELIIQLKELEPENNEPINYGTQKERM